MENSTQREVIFKAIRSDNNQWIQGLICKNVLGNLCIQEHTGSGPGKWVNAVGIKQETICEFTGLHDKKRDMIFEHDRCKYHKNTSKWLVSFIFEVKFINGAYYACWQREMLGKIEQHKDLLSSLDFRNIKILGNIHNHHTTSKQSI